MRLLSVLIFLALTQLLLAQSELDTLESQFITFRYKELVRNADTLLKSRTDLDTSDKIEIYRMKAISHYSLLQDKEAEQSFRNILDMDTSFTLDISQNSPKIVEFFNNVRNGYIAGLHRIVEEKKLLKPDTVYVTRQVDIPPPKEYLKSKITRSLIFPGWGHLYSSEKQKGLILAVLGTASLISSGYFIYDVSLKGNRYSNETDVSKIPGRYDEYNRSFQLRNISLITFAAVWLYSQFDILYLNGDLASPGDALSLKIYF